MKNILYISKRQYKKDSQVNSWTNHKVFRNNINSLSVVFITPANRSLTVQDYHEVQWSSRFKSINNLVHYCTVMSAELSREIISIKWNLRDYFICKFLKKCTIFILFFSLKPRVSETYLNGY
jgi:hypothetical protein